MRENIVHIDLNNKKIDSKNMITLQTNDFLKSWWNAAK